MDPDRRAALTNVFVSSTTFGIVGRQFGLDVGISQTGTLCLPLDFIQLSDEWAGLTAAARPEHQGDDGRNRPATGVVAQSLGGLVRHLDRDLRHIPTFCPVPNSLRYRRPGSHPRDGVNRGY